MKIINVMFLLLLVSAGNASRYGFFGQGRGPIVLEFVRCSGFEENLMDCSNNGLGYSTCSHYEDAGVFCQGERDVDKRQEVEVDGVC